MDSVVRMIVFLLVSIAGACGSVEVHFENKDGGFFLRHTAKQPYQAVADLGAPGGAQGGLQGGSQGGGSQLSVDRFTVFETSQPMSVRATYGPFSTKQTVPARYIVPDPMPFNASGLFNEIDHHLDMSAHMVRGEVPRDSPVVRVLFHAGADSVGGSGLGISGGLPGGRQPVCIVLHVQGPSTSSSSSSSSSAASPPALSASCSPDGEDGVCLAEVVLPASWWVPLPPPDEKPVKSPPRYAKVSYSVVEPRGSECAPRVQIQPMTRLGSVALTAAKAGYRELRSDQHLVILAAHAPLYPRSTMHFPVFFYNQPGDGINGFILRARVKSGLKILGGEASTPDAWNVSVDLNPKLTVATVMAFRRKGPDNNPPPRAEEVLTFLVQVLDEGADLWDEGRLVWTVRYFTDSTNPSRQHHALRPQRDDDTRRKITARLEVHKDDIQAVLPISKNWEVMNTAVLTGRQVSQAMKVFIVSQAGKVADVTLQSSCHSEDESILKVSSSCSSVYVDGSEIRGSWNASVLVKYGTYTGLARFRVWMPEFPLDVSVADFRLSQVKGWRVPDELPRSSGKIKRSVDEQRWDEIDGHSNEMITEDVGNSVDDDKNSACKLRFQQSPVEVYARFLAADHDSGRMSYFVSRRTWLRVTDLVMSLLRISDPRIASLHGHIVQGRSIGRTEVQVLSAISGRVIGAKELRVGSDKVSMSRLRVDVVSGLQLNIVPDSGIDNGYIAETSVTRKLTAQYQEGLLDIDVEFSDGTRAPLREVAVTDYQLVVDSLNPDIVAFAPMVASPHPRVIAVGQGKGELLRVALLVAEACRSTATGANKRTTPLLTNTAKVQVDFVQNNLQQHRPDFVQNDGGAGSVGIGRSHRKQLHTQLNSDSILIGIPLKDDNNHEPTVQARQHTGRGGTNGGDTGNGLSLLGLGGGGASAHLGGGARMTPLEIGMYVLLAAFCFAIVVFVVSCVVYASKFKPQVPAPYFPGSPLDSPPESSIPMMLPGGMPMTSSAPHHSAHLMGGANTGGGHFGPGNQHGGRQMQMHEPTTNAHDWVWLGRTTLERTSGMLVPAAGHAHNQSSSQSQRGIRITANPAYPVAANHNNGNYSVSPSHHVDSATYCKEKPGRMGKDASENLWKILPPPPPLPPHGRGGSDDPDYRPPVPPHRNIGVNANANARSGKTFAPNETNGGRRHHHHHHHHHRNNSGGGGGSKRPPRTQHHDANHNHHDVTAMTSSADFQFTTAEPSDVVKRATIVGNPMFSHGEEEEVMVHQQRGGSCLQGGAAASREELLALEDLNLGMDYQQIMEYFDNLKESNA
ncbi:transmembrane protein 132E-like [Nilaparvata lugens]|uniref:transmembrane protein 132E-like n=1 Tax=Nilaparvata lugens TaxID=108931 RepID=UPI00193EA83F|nr:transmembrane protein 132E-like [Nilaparvata lugens]